MKYLPERDIPKAVRELRTTSTTQVAEWVRKNRTKKTATGKKQQVEVTPQSISMWFLRHPEIRKALELEVGTQEIQRKAITQDLFVNGTLRALPCMKKWHGKLVARNAKPHAINAFTACIRQICTGALPQSKADRKQGNPIKYIEGWGLIHPSELTLEKSEEYLVHLSKHTKHTRRFRIALRNFLKCLGVDDSDDISGKADTEEGKYAHLYVEPEKLERIFTLINERNHEAFKACKFSFKTACRKGATMNAHANMMQTIEGRTYIWVLEKASRGKPKRKLKKYLPPSLVAILPKEGKLFNINPMKLNAILREVYEIVIPEINAELEMPFHFWRHMFAQYMLRATKWNTALVAKWGGWTTEALERYYGKMGDAYAYKNVEQYIV